MNKILLAMLLMFVMFTNLNASENNCTVEKCKAEKRCKAKKNCDKCVKKANTDATMKAPACCKRKKREEAKEEKPEMKCAAGK